MLSVPREVFRNNDSLETRRQSKEELMYRHFVAILTLSMLIAGCGGSLYQVKLKGETKDLDGIPFYIKKARCKQETTYLEPIFEVALIEELDAGNAEWKETGQQSIALSLSGFEAARCQGLFMPDDDQDLRERFKNLRDPDRYSGRYYPKNSYLPSSPDDYQMISDTAVLETYVDYDQVFYINTKRAWSGSSNATIVLAGDGTLTKAEAKIDDTTFQTVLSVLPVSAYLSKTLGLVSEPEVKKALQPEEPPVRTRIRLAVKSTFYVHTFFRFVYPSGTDPHECKPATLTNQSEGVNYRRQEHKPAQAEAPKKEPAITFKGSVVLPTPKNAPTAPTGGS